MRALLLLLLSLAGCLTDPSDATEVDETDSAAEDTATVDCAVLVADPVVAGTVAVDWSTWAPSEEVIVSILQPDAETTLELACADALTQDLVEDYLRVAPTEPSTEVALDPYAGMSLAVSLTDADGIHLWVAGIQAGGATELAL